MTVIYWAGDSTVKENIFSRFPQTGIGQEFHRFLKREIRISNHGENGRSTKSFLDESRLAPIYNNIKEGDFLFIQFGHNDEKKEDPERFTEPFDEYKENLRKFIHVARNRKANPVLITSVERRHFLLDGTLEMGSHEIYTKAMKELAKEEEVPCIDLFMESHRLIQEKGPETTSKWFMHLEKNCYHYYPEGLEDNTHLQPEGAFQFGWIIAQQLEKLGGIYKEILCEAE